MGDLARVFHKIEVKNSAVVEVISRFDLMSYVAGGSLSEMAHPSDF
jgi:hypothetical protein